MAGSAATLGFIVVLNFFLFRVINPHPERTLARGRATTPAQVQAIIEKYGLDEPLPKQFLIYLKNIAHARLRDSYQYSQPVTRPDARPAVADGGPGRHLDDPVGRHRPLDRHHRRVEPRRDKFDQISTASTITLYSMPEWWLGLLLFSAFATGLGPIPRLFPIGRLISTGVDPTSLDGVIDQAWHLVLPVVTLTLAYLAEYSLIMRSALLDEMGEDYLQTSRAKGLRDVLVRRRHATRNALLPVVTLVSLNIGFIVCGAITVETVFSIPGLGLLTTDALRIPDIPVLQGTFFVFSAAVVFANLVSNLLYGYLDPRVRV